VPAQSDHRRRRPCGRSFPSESKPEVPVLVHAQALVEATGPSEGVRPNHDIRCTRGHRVVAAQIVHHAGWLRRNYAPEEIEVRVDIDVATVGP
jgi:hypothetical protein